jgi:hypothetical protein
VNTRGCWTRALQSGSAALRANTTLTSLSLNGIQAWRDAVAGITLPTCMVAHLSLRLLTLRSNDLAAEHQGFVGAALFAHPSAALADGDAAARLGARCGALRFRRHTGCAPSAAQRLRRSATLLTGVRANRSQYATRALSIVLSVIVRLLRRTAVVKTGG